MFPYCLTLSLLVLIKFWQFSIVSSAPTSESYQAAKYLSKFGYFPKLTGDERTDYSQTLPSALLQFQSMARLPLTGVLDDITKDMMLKSRCGVKDFYGTLQKRFAHSGTFWTHDVITWRVRRFSSHIPDIDVLNVLRHAFNLWSDVTNLVFIYKASGQVDVQIDFTYMDHNDGFSFDGEGGVLAHAFAPLRWEDNETSEDLAGDIHFDDDEFWTVTIPQAHNGHDLIVVAVHEIGHSLGLEHSSVPGSVMWPWTDAAVADSSDHAVKLAYDDILAIQLLYGGKQKRYQRADNSQILCQVPVDAVTTATNGRTYLFSGETVIRVADDLSTAMTRPLPISTVFPYFPPGIPVDAAVTYKGIWTEAKTYLFSGDHYYRYSGYNDSLRADAGYPKLISIGWGISESDIDSVFMFENTNKLIFVKGSKYWLHTGTSNGSYPGYPRELSTHATFMLLNTIKAGYFHLNGTNYFFTDNNVQSIDNSTSALKIVC